MAQNNNKPAEVLLKRESDKKSVHLQVLQILHILCFTDVNSEIETFVSSQVFEQYVKFGTITVEIRLAKPIKFTLLPHVNHADSPSPMGFFYQVCEMKINK